MKVLDCIAVAIFVCRSPGLWCHNGNVSTAFTTIPCLSAAL